MPCSNEHGHAGLPSSAQPAHLPNEKATDMKIKIIAPLLFFLIVLASPPSRAQDDSVVLHCKISGEDKLLIVKINKRNGMWEQWDERVQDFRGLCPFESDDNKATCIRSNTSFGWQQVISHDGDKLIGGATISRESGRYERTTQTVFSTKSLRELGSTHQPDAEVIKTGMCDPGESPKPKATRF